MVQPPRKREAIGGGKLGAGTLSRREREWDRTGEKIVGKDRVLQRINADAALALAGSLAVVRSY